MSLLELKYLSQNEKGLSIDDITAALLSKGEIIFKFDTVSEKNNRLTLRKQGDFYFFLIEDYKGYNLLGSGWGQQNTIVDLRDYLKNELRNLGFKEHSTPEGTIIPAPKFENDFTSFTEQHMNVILDDLNRENGSTYKLTTLSFYESNNLLKRLLKMTYDTVSHTYGITMKNITYTPNEGKTTLTITEALDKLEQDFCTRVVTGNEGLLELTQILESLSKTDAEIIEKVIGRDLKVNLGTSTINKVFKDLIVDPAYMRCGVFTLDRVDPKTGKIIKGTSRDINPLGSYIQVKADGTYREVTVDGGHVRYNSRSGETYDYPTLTETFKNFPDGKYIGELTVKGITNRAEGNGLINKKDKDIPHDRLLMECWDYVTLSEYANAVNKDKTSKVINTTTYHDRFTRLTEILGNGDNGENVKVIESYRVNSVSEALEYVSKWMNAGLEGGIWKDKDGIFRDGTSKHQLKLKLAIDCEVRVLGFSPGKKGTDREKTFGAITFQNDEGTIKGQTSGFTNEQLEDFNSRREELIGRVMTVQFNDVTKGRDNDYYALSHPRFICFRDDKDTTDTLERVLEMKQMAMNLSEK